MFFFPIFSSDRGTEPIWPAFQQSPLEALPVVKLRDPLHCTVGEPQLRITPQIFR